MTVPGEKIALFIDGANLYATAKSLGFDIDYKRLLREFQSRGYLLRAFYYTAVIEDQEYSSIRPLIDWLDYNGYSVVTKATKEFVDQTGRRKVKGNMDIELAVDAMEIAGTIDHMVLFSGDGDFRSLVEAVQRKGVRVTVVSTVSTQPPMVADELRRQADVFVDIVDATVQDRPRSGRADCARSAGSARRSRIAAAHAAIPAAPADAAAGRPRPPASVRKTTTKSLSNSGRAYGWRPTASLGATARAARGLLRSVKPGVPKSRPGSMRQSPPSVRIDARLLIVGLAPGLQGANRTGRPFTGDYAGVLLYDTLVKFGFARGDYGAHPDDGLELVDCRITNAVRCVPPENKPTPEEIKTCRDFLVPTIDEMKKLQAIVALGRIAHESIVRALGGKLSDVAFGHGSETPARPYCAVLQLSLLSLQHEHTRAYARDVSQSICDSAPLSRCLKPGDHFLGVLVGRKDRIERLRDRAVVNDKCHALEQSHSGNGKCRQLKRFGQCQLFIRQNCKRQMQTRGRLPLVSGVLGRKVHRVEPPRAA